MDIGKFLNKSSDYLKMKYNVPRPIVPSFTCMIINAFFDILIYQVCGVGTVYHTIFFTSFCGIFALIVFSIFEYFLDKKK